MQRFTPANKSRVPHPWSSFTAPRMGKHVHQPHSTYCRISCLAMKITLAGRSASRRMK